MEARRLVVLAVSFAVLAALYSIDIGIPFQARAVLAITLFAAIMWIFEGLPLHVTSLFIALLLAVLGGFSAKDVFSPFFDPIIALLLGGFVLAVGMQKSRLDQLIALRFVRKVGTSPNRLILGFIIVSAFISFWMTNTATTLIMLPIAISILKDNGLKPLKSNFGKAIVLAIAFAATVGGVGTIIGSTPNAIAVKFLADQGIGVSFLDWMVFGVPLVLITIPVIWITTTRMFKSEVKKLRVREFKGKVSRAQKKVLGVFIVTVALWLTTGIHGIPETVVSLVPIILLYLLKVLDTKDFGKVGWDALIMFGGGLALGSAVHSSGLDVIMANSVAAGVAGQPLFVVLLVVVAVGVVLTAIASNTAAASLFIPVIIPFAVMFGIDIRFLVVLGAIAVSLDFVVLTL